ncbi:MAG: hypothetical protein DRO40_07865 [Thermoprotei archaeon]|nr:MAG: hypothetical protein DRO40_07865 [Thermoprotei archaeon]
MAKVGLNGKLHTKMPDIVDMSFDQACLKCPFCGFEYNHPTRVRVLQKPLAVEVTADNVIVREGEVGGYGRGSTIELEFYCENGHLWTLEMHFHKGIVFLEAVGKEVDLKAGIKEFWRD